MKFADLTLLFYCSFVAVQLVIKGKNRSWADILRVLVSIIFTRFMGLFQNLIHYHSGWLPTDLMVLALGILLTGVGASMTVDMMLVPNPGDGIVHSISIRTGKELGLCKNCFDLGCVTCSLVIGAAFGHVLLGVGLGKSRQKYLYLPEEHNDCIFAVVCEELGLIGACVVMLLFALLILRASGSPSTPRTASAL